MKHSNEGVVPVSGTLRHRRKHSCRTN